MNKADLVQIISEEHGMSKSEAERVCANVLDTMVLAAAETGKAVFGRHRFTRKDYAARTGVNPKTGEKIEIAPKSKISYKNSAVLA